MKIEYNKAREEELKLKLGNEEIDADKNKD